MKQTIADQKPLLDKLNKTGPALVKLLGEDEAEKMQSMIADANDKFDAIKNNVRETTNTLDEALQQTSEVGQ